mmetsp:Transcript_7278/g.9020  ORF Transcript_7278/g.9020 Transcript_7278/m.9020 type:complete len:88 (+) Transcript_7278:662-925(+)
MKNLKTIFLLTTMERQTWVQFFRTHGEKYSPTVRCKEEGTSRKDGRHRDNVLENGRVKGITKSIYDVVQSLVYKILRLFRREEEKNK